MGDANLSLEDHQLSFSSPAKGFVNETCPLLELAGQSSLQMLLHPVVLGLMLWARFKKKKKVNTKNLRRKPYGKGNS